jgi:hypothetical protein
VDEAKRFDDEDQVGVVCGLYHFVEAMSGVDAEPVDAFTVLLEPAHDVCWDPRRSTG